VQCLDTVQPATLAVEVRGGIGVLGVQPPEIGPVEVRPGIASGSALPHGNPPEQAIGTEQRQLKNAQRRSSGGLPKQHKRAGQPLTGAHTGELARDLT
jgi:hypothetical protein